MPERSPFAVRPRLLARLALLGFGVVATALAGAAGMFAQSVQHAFPGVTATGSSASALVTVTPTVSGTLSEVRVLTNGVSGKDFQVGSGGTCTTYVVAGTPCTVSVTFAPTAPGRRSGAVVLVQGSPLAVLGSQPIDGVATGSLAVIQPGQVVRVAGDGNGYQYVGGEDGKSALSAHVYLPRGVVGTPAGDFYISDTFNNRIRHVDAATTAVPVPAITTITSDVNQPSQLALDGAGNLFFADTGNNLVRRLDHVTGAITTVAGGGVTPFTVDGVPATAAALQTPYGIALDADGSLFIADTGNSVIRKVDAVTGLITTVAGTGMAGFAGDGTTAAQLNQPFALAIGPDGLLYIADEANQAIRRLNANGTVSTVAGVLNTPFFDGDGGPAKLAHLAFPTAIALDPAGNLYIADSQNNRVRRVKAVNGSLDNANIESVVSIGNTSVTTTNSTLLNADSVSLSGPFALSLDASNDLYISDAFNRRILLVYGNKSLLRYPDMKVGKTSVPQPVKLENDGDAALNTSSFTFDQSKLDAATTTCTATGTLAVNANCTLGVQFAPTTVSANGVNPLGTLTVSSDAGNAPDVITLQGLVLSVEPTNVVLTSLPTGSVGLGAPLTLSALVSETSGTGIPTGTAQMYDGTTPIGSPVPLQAGRAEYTTTSLSLGTHTLTAQYSGDDNNAASTSNALTVLVLQTTSVSIQTSGSPAPVTQPVTFTAKIAATTAVTSGTVEFYDGTALLGTGSVNAASTASFTISTLIGGTHAITAKFTGDLVNAGSTSAVLQQVITKAASTTLVGASPSTITVGNQTVLTASVTSSGPAPTGTVTFLSGTTALGSGTLDASGTVRLPVSTLAPTSASVTAVYSGDNYNSGSTSSPTVVTVNKLATVTTIASSGSPSNAGSTLVLTATVAMSPGQTAVGAVTGTVTFSDGSAVLQTVPLNNGTATLSTTGLTVGSHAVTATYNGSTNYAGSTSSSLTQQVVITSSTTTLSTSSNAAVAGTPVTLTAAVTATGTVKPTGTVVFSEGGSTLGSVPLTASTGQAALTLTSLAPGAHTIVASYSGDANYAPSASAPTTVTVRQGTTSLALSAAPARTTYGTPVTATIKLVSDGVLPANPVVTLLDNGTSIATQTVDASGSATATTSTLSVGTHNLVVQYAGNANNAAAQSAAVVVTIDAAASRTVLSSSNLTPQFGQVITLQAAVSSTAGTPGGNVTFQEGATVLGIGAVNASGVATLSLSSLNVGTHTIVAIYGGDATHAASTSGSVTETVTLATQTSVTSSANPVVAGLAVTFNATVTGTAGTSGVTAQPTGLIAFFDGTTPLGTGAVSANGTASLTLSTLAVGAHTITASYRGDANFQASVSSALTQTVRSAGTQTVLSTSGSPAPLSSAVTLTVRVTGEGATPTGTVTFRDGTVTIGQAALANGAAALTISTLSPGVHPLTASYSGDAGNEASVSAVVQQSVLQPTQVTLVSSSNPALTLDTPVLTATVKGATAVVPTGPVQFLEGTRLLGTGTLDANGTALITAAAFSAGTHQIVAVYAGDAASAAVTSTPLTLTVNVRPTQISLTATAPTQANGGALTLIAIVRGAGSPGPSGLVTFTLNGKTLGTSSVDATGVAALNVGATAVSGGNVVATYAGDANYGGATSAEITLPSQTATNFLLSLNPSPITMPSGQYVTAYLTIQSVSGYSDTLLLGCLGLPYASTCTFEKDTVTLPSNGAVRVKVIVDTGSPLTAGGEFASNVHGSGKGALLATLPAGAVLLLLLRRRRGVPALLALLSVMILLPVVGCGTLNQTKTPVGSYTMQVSVSSKASTYTQSLPVSLTVTQ